MKILPSALKHGIREDDIARLVDSDDYLEILLSPGVTGPRYMIAGLVPRLNFLLEVGMEYPEDQSIAVVFHADKAREPIISMFKDFNDGKKKKRLRR